MRRCVMLVALGVWALSSGTPIRGHELLIAQVSPRVGIAPGFIRVRALVEASNDNRALEVVAQSIDYTRSSTIELHGEAAPRLNVFQFTGLPAGEYDVRAALLGPTGVRAVTAQTVQIMSGAAR